VAVKDGKSGTTLDVLRHPVRIRIVEACTAFGSLSPVQLRNRQLCADVESVKEKTWKQQLSHLTYHCQKLADAGILTLVSERPVRGATEHFYKANIEAAFTDAEWAVFGESERRDISRVVWQRFVAQVEGAMRGDSFDARTDRWLAWGPLDLDERAWKELTVSVAGCYAEIDQIRKDAEARLADSTEMPLRITYALFAFETPDKPLAMPDRPSADRSGAGAECVR
jgi:hypothetical protein